MANSTPFTARRLAGPSRNPSQVGAGPARSVEDHAAVAPLEPLGEAIESGRDLAVGRRRGAEHEAALVGPLLHRLAGIGIADAFGGAPGVLAEEQEIAPGALALEGALLDPGRSRSSSAGSSRSSQSASRSAARSASWARRKSASSAAVDDGAILPIEPGITPPHRDLAAESRLDLPEEVLRAPRHDARKGVAAVELLHVRDHPLVHQGIVPLHAVEQRQIVGPRRRLKGRVGQRANRRAGAPSRSAPTLKP